MDTEFWRAEIRRLRAEARHIDEVADGLEQDIVFPKREPLEYDDRRGASAPLVALTGIVGFVGLVILALWHAL